MAKAVVIKRFITSEEATACKKQPLVPCSDCPWSRKSYPGWVGPNTVEEWVACVHTDTLITCHALKQPGGPAWQCAGAAIYRANVCKLTRDPRLLRLEPNTKLVFSWGEFEEHHGAR